MTMLVLEQLAADPSAVSTPVQSCWYAFTRA